MKILSKRLTKDQGFKRSKINKLKDWIKDIQKISLEEISSSIIQDINKEIERVLPYEQIYVVGIKDRITLKKRWQ